ncbi:MAG: hypothetical protein AAFV07_19940 [Bacteroidota bacterium]
MAQEHHVPDSLLPIHTERIYYPNTHQLAEKASYYFDHWSERKIRHGWTSTWDQTGRLLSHIHYRHDTLSGICERYYPNGNLKSKQHYHKGQLDGPAASYAPDGRLKWRGFFRAGIRHGNFLYYRRDGSERKRRVYHYGLRKSDVNVANS